MILILFSQIFEPCNIYVHIGSSEGRIIPQSTNHSKQMNPIWRSLLTENQRRLKMNIKINGKLLLAILVSIIIFFIALYLNEIEHSDAIYTSLYYLPIIIVGLWYYRFVIPLAIIYSLQFCILDCINLGSVSIDQIIRGLVMITGSVIMYYLGQRLNEKNKELEISRSTLAIEKEHLRITLQSIGDGVISADYNGNVIMLNEVAKNLTGWLGDTAIGRPF